MDEEERADIMADLIHYRELLSGALDQKKLTALEYIIGHLEKKLAAIGPPSPANPLSTPAVSRSSYRRNAIETATHPHRSAASLAWCG
jgi:hypothetical protein